MKTILATAYAINPYKGSEDGMGWNYVSQIARNNKVIAVTRENNKAAIDEFMMNNPKPYYSNIEFVYFDLPYWMRFWKKGKRGALLYFLLWQRMLIPHVKKHKLNFDIAHNLNFHNDWTPSFLYKLNKPMVWGPIGHHPKIKKQYLIEAKLKTKVKEIVTWIIKNYFWKLSPSLYRCKNGANHIWCMNSSVPPVLKTNSNKLSISPSVASEDYCKQYTFQEKTKNSFLSIGRFVPLKGFDLSIEAFGYYINSLPEEEKNNNELVLVGKGSDKEKLIDLAKKCKVDQYIKFNDWLPRHKIFDHYKSATAFLFPSHEGAGMVIPEALSFGLPCICLDNVGPGEFIDKNCGIVVKESDRNGTIQNLAKALEKVVEKGATKSLSIGARKHYLKHFTWESRGIKLAKIYRELSS